MSLVLDIAVAGIRPTPSTRVRDLAPRSGAGRGAPPAPAPFSQACDDALVGGRAPVVTLGQTHLWPPNHALIDVGLAVDPTPECAGLVDLEAEVWGDERADEPAGDGTTVPDARFDGDDLYLRSERVGSSDGRVYLVLSRASSATATGVRCRTVVVPQSGTASSLAAVNAQAAAAVETCHATGQAPAGFHPLAEARLSRSNRAPSVNAGADQGVDFPGPALLDATVSDDGLPDGHLDVEWTFASGPGTVTFAALTEVDTAATFTAAGAYVLRLTARDGALESSDDVVVVVAAANEAPVVNAGDDQSVVLPANVATLAGSATDDGRPNAILAVAWTVASAPAGATVEFSSPSTAMTTAALSDEGEYVIRLTANDGQFTVSDEVVVTVRAEALPILSIADAEVTEGNEGRGGGELHASLSRTWPRPVTVDFMTSDGTATANCDYATRFGTLVVPAGETSASVLLPVVGELAPEAAETVRLRLGNVMEATLATDEALLTILDDDVANQRPTIHSGRSPANLSTGIAMPPTLAWTSRDPDPGDLVLHDIYLGTAASLDGQGWSRVCPSAPGPPASTAFALDDAGDRLLVLEQGSDGVTGSRVWVLSDATGAGGPSRWSAYDTAGAPRLRSALGVYVPSADSLAVVGACADGCATLDAWALEGAFGNAPGWRHVVGASAPPERVGFAHASADDRIFLFGGIADDGSRLADLWMLTGWSGLDPRWTRIVVPGDHPAPRDGATLVVDALRDRLLVFGGRLDDLTATNELWALERLSSTAPAWRLVGEGDGPPARFRHAAAFDDGLGRMIVFGGTNAGVESNLNFVFSDAWLLEGDAWSRIALPPPPPPARFDAIAAFSPSANRLIVAAGMNNKLPAHPQDLWVLNDAAGRLPAAALAQPSETHVADGLDAGATYLWRVVTRDQHGAWRGSPIWRFTGNRRPVVDAGADGAVELPPGEMTFSAAVTDDGLPAGGQLTMQWSVVSGPAAVSFSGGQTPAATATFTAEGTYVLRLAASDGVLGAHDDVTVVVEPPNAPPSVDAGADQAIALPQTTVALTGIVEDDGRPASGALTAAWTQVGGPAQVTFADGSQPATSVTLGPAGVYVLRLTATDGRATAADDVTVTVAPANGAPHVDAGPDQAITLPADTAILTGTVADDGRPFGTLTHAWAQVAGPAPVVFGTPNAPVTTVTFTQLGAYRLRLSVSDGALSSDDETRVVVGSTAVLPDLVVERVDTGGLVVDPSTLTMTGTVVAEMANPGPGAAAAAFAVTFFEDRNRSGVFESADDLVLGTATAGPVGPGETFAASATVAAAATFAGNLLHAFVDSGVAIVEGNEGNNYGNSAPACMFTPPVRAANPALEWSWTGSPTLPLSNKVHGSPLVIDLDLDGTPEIVFQTNRGYGPVDYAYEGSLRAVDGATHAEVFTTGGAGQWLTTMPPIAAGNIDGDPHPEIIAAAQGEQHLLAFEHDGTLKWRSVPVEYIVWGAVALADLDGDGVAEIVLGRQVLNNDGTLRWTGTGGRGSNSGFGPNATVVDLDLDGRPEVVAGNTAYRGSGPQQGQILWQTTSAPGGTVGDGYAAAANFDDDPNPEIVLVASGIVWMLEHDGAVKWGPVVIPGNGFFGSAAAIGNLDGDPELEFVVGGRERMVVFESDGAIAWTAPFPNLNREHASAALFDFDGDGAAEIVYRDEYSMRIFGGGQVLFEARTWGNGAGSNPVIADADGDGKVEIVFTDNGPFTLVPSAPGLRVFGDSADTWLLARPMWNQRDYHVSNVNDDGSIPAIETRSLDSSRQNVFARVGGGTATPGCAYAKPDLTASFLRVARDASSVHLTARIGNGGAAIAGSAVPVSFYDGDPAAGATLLGTVFTSALMPAGAYEDVVLALPAATTTSRSIWIAADDTGSLHGMTTEANEDNNVYDSGRALLGRSSGVDLVVSEVDTAAIATDPATLTVSGNVRARILNQGDAPATGPFVISFFEDADADGAYDPAVDLLLGETAHGGGLGGREEAETTAPVTGVIRFAGNAVHAMVDSAASIAETNESNNLGSSGGSCRAIPPVGAFTPAMERRWLTSATDGTSTNVAATPLVADLDADGVADIVFVTFIGSAATTAGRLRALSGRDGHELFTITDPAHALSGWANLALGDIDGDSRPEIVAVHEQNRLIAFEHDGAFKWLSPPLLNIEWGGPVIADLDGMGLPEIVLGRQALRADGSLAWTAPGGNRGGNTIGTFATVADLDLDGTPEVLVGDAAYSNAGALLWDAPFPDGHTAVANFDGDPFPEIVLVAANLVWLLEHDGTRRWGPLTLPGNGYGNAPVIADFDGDGRPEIGVGTRSAYTVVETAGTIRWSVPTIQVASPWNTGVVASAFDFDGDGETELVYSDESGLKVRRGRDGALLAEQPVPSCVLGRSFPLVADVDGDGNAEIVAPANRTCSAAAAVGIAVIGELHDRWVTARPLWNQSDYRIVDVGDDASVPPRAVPSWSGSNTFRANSFGSGSPFRAPDLNASYIRRAEDGTDLAFTVRVGNAGDGAAGPGIPVSLYNGDPRLGFTRVATVTTTHLLRPGEFEDVEFRVASATAAEDPLHVGVDWQDGNASMASECSEDDNVVATDLYLNREPVANAGADSVVVMPADTAVLSGTASDDGLPLGSTLVVAWDYVSGPTETPPVIANRSSLTTTVRLVVPGAYVFRLIASDSVRSFQDLVNVRLLPANQAPQVDAGADQVIAYPATSTVLAGTVSDDGQPSAVVTYQWGVAGAAPGAVTFATPAAVSTLASFGATGTYRLSLTASDGALSSTDEVEVIVDSANVGPVVSAGPDRVLAGRTTQIEGSANDDGLPRGGSLSVTWSLVEGAGVVTWVDVHAAATGVDFSADGLYLLRLTATDGELFSYDDVIVRVNPLNLPPAVNAGADQAISTDVTTLAGTVGDDGLPIGGGLAATWSMASGPGHVTFADAASPTTIASFSADGDYVLSLAATDSVLQSADTVTVRVDAGNHAPLVNAGPDATLPAGEFATSLTGEISDDGIPGDPLSATWSQVSGPGIATFGAAHSASSGVSFDAPGVYVLRLTGWDGLRTAFDEVRVSTAAESPSGDPPAASLSSPVDGDGITAPTEVTGSVASDSLLGWALEYRRPSEAVWTRFAGGSTPGPVAGVFDPTLLSNGLYELRVRATDRSGRSATAGVHVVLKGNAKVGAFSVSFVDLEVPVAGLPIRVTRTYDSRDKTQGDFGYGWRTDVSTVRVEETGIAGLGWTGTTSPGYFPTYCLQPSRAKAVTLTMPDGKVLEFEPVLTPQCQTFVPVDEVTVGFRARPGTLGTLEAVGGSSALVVGAWPAPLQTSVMELFASNTFQIYDPAEYRYTSPDGRVFVVDERSGLRTLTDRSGNTLTVSAAGIIHSSGKGVAFVRDGAGRIRSMVDPAGQATTYAYDLAGNLASVTDRAGQTTRFAYHGRFPHHLERITDPQGRQPIRNDYFDDGRIKSHTDAFGKTITYTHDVAARQEVVVDRNGKQRVLDFDTRGNVVRETDAAGKIVRRTFDPRDNRLTETVPHVPGTPTPPTTVYTYDGADNVASMTDPGGNRTEYTYNARQQVLTTRDARGRITENTYDPVSGNLLTTRDAAGQVNTYTYGAQGNLRTQTVVVDGVPQVTSYEYDGHGNMTRETDALGHETTSTYDANGNRLTQTTTRGIYTCGPAGCTRTSVETLTTTYVYDDAGRLTETHDPEGGLTRTVYDELGRQKEAYDKAGRRTAFEYDEMGRLVRTVFADTTDESSTYDNEGRRLTSRDREGQVTSYTYDDVGRLLRTTYPDTTFTESTYDDAGRLVASRDARGKATSYGYDTAGRRTLVRDPLGNETVFGYDPNGNQTTVRDARGFTTTFEYDELNRRTKTIFPDLSTALTSYDALGRRRSETDQAGRITRFDYDKVGRLVRVTDAAGKETAYTYDELGNRIAQRDALGRVTWFEYDRLGREVARNLPDGARESRVYDVSGNVRERVDFLGRATSYTYDGMGRLASRSYPTASSDVSFTYTASGRRLTAVDARGVTTYGYDTRQRLASLTHPDGRKLEYGYDGNGGRTSLTARVGSLVLSTGFTYDDAGRLDLVTDPEGRTYDHGYDANGNRASLAYPNGTVAAYTYNTLNRLTDLTTAHPASGRTIQGYAFTLGAAGNRTAITEADGTVRGYTYDSLYRLTSERVTVDAVLQYEKVFGYDDVGNRMTQVTTGSGAPGNPTAPASVAYTYDTRDRLLTETLVTGPGTSYGYDANGNLVTKSAEATYTWDFENRLIRVAKADGVVVEHTYDVDGVRVSTRVIPAAGPSAVTEFLVDTSGSLSHVVAETNAAGALQAYYVRADDLLAVMRPSSPGWTTRFVHADGIGSIRRLTDEDGLVTDGYTYTAFGELIAHTGTDPQPYAFAGEPYDPNSGFQYHRARWMDPGTGRFLGTDPFEGLEHDPPSLHRYLYASADPVNAVDPTGRYTLTQLAVTGAIIGALAGASIYTLTRERAEDFTWTGFGAWTLGGAILGAAVGAGVYYGPVISIRWAGAAPGVLKTWQEAEKFVSRTLNLAKNSTDLLINGRIRIPDFLDQARHFIGDSKFVSELYLTGKVGQQLRDYADYCRANGYRFYIFVRHDTKVGQSVINLVEETGGSIVRMFVQD